MNICDNHQRHVTLMYAIAIVAVCLILASHSNAQVNIRLESGGSSFVALRELATEYEKTTQDVKFTAKGYSSAVALNQLYKQRCDVAVIEDPFIEHVDCCRGGKNRVFTRTSCPSDCGHRSTAGIARPLRDAQQSPRWTSRACRNCRSRVLPQRSAPPIPLAQSAR